MTGRVAAVTRDSGRELGAFLRVRRGRVAPESVGLTAGRRRRVRGLRREELAQLAGISVDYYVRLEQGRATQPSDEVLDALAGALRLDHVERRHLATLAHRPRGAATAPPAAEPPPVRDELRRVLAGMPGLPAVVLDERLDVLAWNALGGALFGGLDDPAARDRNQARFLFLDPAARRLFPDLRTRRGEDVALLRHAVGRYPEDARLAALVAELTERSGPFRELWEDGDVRRCTVGRKRFRHPALGVLDLDSETLHVPPADGRTGQRLHVYSAAPGSPAAAALRRLAEPPADAEALGLAGGATRG
ncbi:helix-turn-helix transcriptional regulator [Streptomyces sp. DSM 44915]|uniref:Helix-turn-helix transcriptional regulator n=1 Tax=Streptomyces chisholmiae TaxID=3075540 RepID=A0ABU2JNU3_9ACTN|nr:helix-turn-helix transcriptional regulator [Streptomyces sp. DSM 44915]MDT0266398.1 helix-turn-helix transcriptional regulator [Streptomyces sp. DSM 44915]